MNRQLQIELWPECRCFRCAFCNLALNVERDEHTTCSPNIKLSVAEKKGFIERANSFLPTVNWAMYDMLLIRGGEVFNDYDEALLSTYSIFIDRIAYLMRWHFIEKLFLITSLKYEYSNSLLKWTLERLHDNDISLKHKVLVGTSWDAKYRFDSKAYDNWYNNLHKLDAMEIPVHITSILTQAFIDKFNDNDKEIKYMMDRDFDFIAAQGKPELLRLKDFFPKRQDCLKFLTALSVDAKYQPIQVRMINQNERRAESIFFTERNSFETRDLKSYRQFQNEAVYNKKCGHPLDYANYADSDACFLCDMKTLFGTC